MRATIWDHVEVTGFCWIWAGGTWKGYGRFSGEAAHRLVWLKLVGAIDDGMELDHLCRIPLCVNPDHLEPVTRLENMRRRYALVATCSNGHPFDADNTYLRPSGHRDCRACIRARVAAYRERVAA